MPKGTLKTPEEIEHMHAFLEWATSAYIVKNEETAQAMAILQAQSDALCWVLGHPRGQEVLDGVFEAVIKDAENAGVHITKEAPPAHGGRLN